MSKEARELAQRFGVRMCDENGMTHGEELYCLGLDDIIAMKEALAKQEQGEPVAWMYESVCGNDFATRNSPPDYAKNIRPLGYTTPQQRTWEGLSVFEINDLVENTEYEDYHTLVETVEAKLKEKNT